MDINFNNQTFTLLPSGGIYFHQGNALIIADLHLGKGVQLQDSGVPLPEQIDEATIDKFKKDLERYTPEICIICGDLIHAHSKHLPQHLDWFCNQISHYKTTFILTRGNHDSLKINQSLPIFDIVTKYTLNGIHFTHHPGPEFPNIHGHIHPGVKLSKGRISKYYKAFSVDEKRIICPSYGIHTGTFSKLDPNKDYYIIDGDLILKL